MDVEAYFNSKESYLKKEEVLFTIIDELYRESAELFSEIVDLSDESYYKISSLKLRIEKLNSLYHIIDSNYEKINKIELSSYDYATRRYLLKNLLTMILSLNILFFNVFLSIGGYLALSKINNKSYAEELTSINDRILRFDEEKLKEIKNMLGNCQRIFEGKHKHILEKIKIDEAQKESIQIMQANDAILAYINGRIEYKNIERLSKYMREIITNILKQDLGIKENNIYQLLAEARQKEVKHLKLIKKYEN